MSSEPQLSQSQPPSSTRDVVQQFFGAFGRGGLPSINALFHPKAKIVAVRDGVRRGQQLHGSYSGREGLAEFLSNLGRVFETQAFELEHLIAEGPVAFASGSFTHLVKSTGKHFSSAWALKCLVQDQQIVEYQFYEDSAALVAVDPSAAM